jgi:tetratricopeptide (TPR) repeat protein
MNLAPQPPADLNRGLVNLAAGRYGLAIADLEKALNQESHSEKVLNLLGVAYDRIGRHDVARTYLSQALTLAPKSAETLYNMGNSFYLESDYPAAQRYFEKASALAEGSLQNAVRGRLLVLQDRLPQPLPQKAAVDVSAHGTSRAQQLVRTSDHTYELNTAENTPNRTPDTCDNGCASAPVMAALSEPSVEPPPQPPAVVPRPVEVTQVVGSVPNFARLQLEVSNGAGRHKLAARVSHFLTTVGLQPRYVTNADRFNYTRTTIVYRQGFEAAAQHLARQFPVDAELVPSTESWPNLRIILGTDMLPFDRTLSTELQEAGHAELLG